VVAGEIPRPVDVLVIGGGPGGYTAAARAAELGREVVLVERNALGGVCLNVGCIPSKALITVAHDLARSRRAGLVGDAVVDLPAVQAWKQKVVERQVGGVERLLANVEIVEGTARFVDRKRVAVEDAEHVSHFRFEHAIIASGSRPVELDGLPYDGERTIDSTASLALTELPTRLAVVGGGYIGLELGTAYAKLGSDVVVVEAMDHLLDGFDAELVAVVERRLTELGVRVALSTPARLDLAELREADRILVAVGRRPNTDDLQLEDAGLAPRPDGRLDVDEQMRTANPAIFAIGDVVPGPALAHKAAAEGRVAVEVVAGLPVAFDQVVPLIAFTDPELASVGLIEAEVPDAIVGRARFAASGRALTLDDAEGLVKVVADRVGTIVGVHIAGPSASDLIGEGLLAVEMAAHLDDVTRSVHPHPTLAEAFADAAFAARRRLQRSDAD
jgi:dihydrolipoyl dehydrogenase